MLVRMFEVAEAVGDMVRAVDVLACGLEPELVPASACRRLVAQVARAERQLAGVKARLAGRVADTSGWKGGGHRSAAHWLAKQSGTSVAQAVSALQTAEQLKALPATTAAVQAGSLSPAQTAAVCEAASVAPEAEADLIALAGEESLKALVAESTRRKTAHLDEDARHQRVHDSRFVRFGSEADGAATISVRTTADALAEIRAAIEHHQQRAFEAARQAGRRESSEAYAADGLLAMARASMGSRSSASAAKRVPTKVVIRVDHRAVVRGHTEPGEVCEISGVGPVPPRRVAAMVASGEVFTAAVATGPSGQVTRVAHLGHRPVTDLATLPAALAERGHEVTSARSSRRPDAYQQTALDWTAPLCSVAGCDRPRRQIDHRDDWARTQHTKLDELDGYCDFHHAEKTREGPKIPAGIGRRTRLPGPEP
jgi:hypothetical protein